MRGSVLTYRYRTASSVKDILTAGPCARGLERASDPVGRERLEEVVALELLAPMCGEEVRLVPGLDALGDDCQTDAVRQADDRGQERRTLSVVVVDVHDEGPVDLEPVDLQLTQSAQ